MLGAVALATVGLIAAFATNAYASASSRSTCGRCHAGPVLTVLAAETANNGATATYSVSSAGADYIAVFDGATKLTQINGSSGSISVAVGKTYVLNAVAGPSDTTGWGSTSISPVAPAPAPDTAAPTTISDARSTYVSSAAIHLTATDEVGGSGVATTYYVLDGAGQVAGTNVSTDIVGSHTLVFWSVDAAGNIESQNSVAFEVTAPMPQAAGRASARIHVMAKNGRGVAGVTVILTNKTTGAVYSLMTSSRGYATFAKLPRGTYSVSATLANGHKLTASFKVTHHRATIKLKDHTHKSHKSHSSASRSSKH